jgi:hypothetical protein
MSWEALRFALDCDKCESVAEKIVLIEYANHADDRGYSWPSLKFIASAWRTHRVRLRRARDSIIEKKLLFRTKKRCGATRQNKVFRMPKCTYKRGTESTTFKNDKGGYKGVDKGSIRGSKSTTNPDTDNHESISIDNTLRVASTAGEQLNGELSKSFVEKYQYQKQNSIPRDHVKWPEFAGWCRSKRDKRGLPGAPTEEGFWKWLCAQKPQWRNKVKERFEESGYVLNGKWLTADEAIHLGRENPQLLTKFRAAVKRNGKIIAGDSATKQGD